jgi:predicted nuclease of restriction endonuclease-like (RecB) superfamily
MARKDPNSRKNPEPIVRRADKREKPPGTASHPAAYDAFNAPGHHSAFAEVAALVETARYRAHRAANTTPIDLYWAVGEYISRKVKTQSWGKSVVGQLAEYLALKILGKRGFSASNLWRMMQFYDAYHEHQILATMLRELSWSSNLLILGRCRSTEEREFYLRASISKRWQVRELERQLNGSLFARTLASPPKFAAVLREIHPKGAEIFRDSYSFDFLDLPERHSEKDLEKGLVADLKWFLAELGRDFCYVGEQYPVQVGNEDFFIDLLFYHRELQCLVAFELKIGRFKPQHLGQLSFYLEALDRDVRKSHEKPSVGILLCAGKDTEVVEYALSRTLSPALVAEYRTRLPERELLRQKLAEFYELETRKRR